MRSTTTTSEAGQPGLVVLVTADAESAAVLRAHRAVSLLWRTALPGHEEAGAENTTAAASAGPEASQRGSMALVGPGFGPLSARGRRAASLRSAVGVRGRIPSGTSQGSVASPDADIELVAARGRRAAALRSLVGASGRAPRVARSVA